MDYRNGDEIDVVIDRNGLSEDFGVGHLSDETMVIIIGAGGRVGETIHATITGMERTRLGASFVANAKI